MQLGKPKSHPIRSGVALLAFAAATGRAVPAQALPIFAHRYDLSCQACHTTVPTLNAFGRAFLRGGFRLPGGRGTFPLAVKTQLVYQSGGSDPGAGDPPLPKAIVDEIELLSAGSIGRNASYYVEQYALDGGLPGQSRDIWVDVSRFARAGDAAGPAFHAKLGQFTLPLPVDPETQRPTLSSYLLYEQTIGTNPFDLFDPGLGADLSYTDDRRGIELHVDALAAYARGSGIPYSGINLFAAASKTVGNDLTLWAYRYQGQTHVSPIPDSFYRQAYGAGYARGKFAAQAIVQTGYDTSAAGLGAGGFSSGGFLQTSWTFDSAHAVYARYDSISDALNLRTNQATLSLILRPSARSRFTLEATRAQHASELAAGFLFAY